jgi:uncharacterized membrane protein affecting hemolysin expression
MKTLVTEPLTRFWRNTLAREIVLVLLVKLVVITVIKQQFFSNPVDKQDAHQGVEQMWLLPKQQATDNSEPAASASDAHLQQQPGSLNNG